MAVVEKHPLRDGDDGFLRFLKQVQLFVEDVRRKRHGGEMEDRSNVRAFTWKAGHDEDGKAYGWLQ